MSPTISLTVTRTPDQWVMEHISAALITTTKTARRDRDASDVLRQAERMASGGVLWRLTGTGFEAVISGPRRFA